METKAKSDARKAYVCRHQFSTIAVILATILVAWFAYYSGYYPVIHSDDWSRIVAQHAYGDSDWLDWSDRRPLLYLPLTVLTGLFGLNIHVLYLVIVGLHVLASLQYFGLLRRTGVGSYSFALIASLLFLVYPADYTSTWLTMIGIWVAMNLLFAYAHLLLSFMVTGAFWILVASCTTLIVSLGFYEGQWGLALAWALLLTWIRKDASRERKLAVLIPVAIGLAFMVWRTLGLRAAGISDPYIERLQFNPFMLAYRAMFGLGILVWSWAAAMRGVLQLDNKLLPAGLVALAVGLFAGVGLAIAHASQKELVPLGRIEHKMHVRGTLKYLGLGVVLAVAGFIPVISIYLPSLSGVTSRVNLFALPGASLAVAAALQLIALLLGRNEHQIKLIAIFSALPLLFIGIGTQAWVRHDAQITWLEQKRIWAELVSLVPNFADDTAVYLILADSQDRLQIHPWRRMYLAASWEVTSALQVLYGNRTLRGDRLFLDDGAGFAGSALLPEGVFDYATKEIVPYERTVFVAFDEHLGTARIVEDLGAELSLPWAPIGYLPQSRTKDPPMSGFEYRWIVDLPAFPP